MFYIGTNKFSPIQQTSVTPSNKLKVTSNGTYTPVLPYTGYTEVQVDVPSPKLQNKVANSNGKVLCDTGFDGLGEVEVQVSPKLQQLQITNNGTYAPSTGFDGIGSVQVNVQAPKKSFSYNPLTLTLTLNNNN